KDIEVLYHQAIQAHQHQLVYPHGEEWHIPVRKLQKANPLATVYFELVREWGFTPQQLPDLLHLLEADTGKWVASPTHRIIRNRDWLILAPLVAQQPKQVWIDQLPAQVTTAHFTFQLASARLPVQPDQQDPSVAYVNATLLSFPLLLRPWKNGDYFYPLGMRKMKKVSRFLIDAKVSKTDKEKVWVLESNRKIVWVVGHRIDDRFRLTDTVKEVARLSVKVL
ncbi:MAG: tRNA lysidine(34) synthetase TilS, partial [Chitinophagaceae bacterium]